MTGIEYVHVDVFSDRPYGGNSLPVFLEYGDLAAEDMLQITRELRHFEAVFLRPTSEPDLFEARVFDLLEELPFAGHPLIGAAAVLQHRHDPRRGGTWRLALSERTVSVDVAPTVSGCSAFLDQGAATFLSEVANRADVAKAFGLTTDDFDTASPLEVGSTGLRYLVVPVTSDALRRARVRVDIAGQLQQYGAQFAVLFDKTRMELRHWNNDGIVEDIATGSAAGVVGAYALRHGLVASGDRFAFSQGRFTGRPSTLHVIVSGAADAISSVKVGGDVAFAGRGVLDHRPRMHS